MKRLREFFHWIHVSAFSRAPYDPEQVIEMADGNREPDPTAAFNALAAEETLEVARTEKPTRADVAAAAGVTEEEAKARSGVEVDSRPLAQQFLDSSE
ncbi:hypothetical protein [Spongiactinospora sp. 9N601]|uniref:hypothetical protein n=1 Tax=Spongiactinospora sp. 9N601 TaxID=3375149 RepID=UPI00378B628F